MILSESQEKIEKFCKDIRYQLDLLESHMVVYKDGKKPLITQKQYSDAIRNILAKVTEVENEMPEDFEKEKSLNDKFDEIQNKIGEIILMLNEVDKSIEEEAQEYDKQVHEAIGEIDKERIENGTEAEVV